MKQPICFLLLLFVFTKVDAQYQYDRYDSNYYVSYRDKLTLGPLLAKKNTAFKMNAPDAEHAFRYLSNSPGRFGIFADHDFLSLSASFGIGTIDPSYKKEKGSTKQTNLQLSVTGRKVLVDLYVQKYKGLYANISEPAIYNSNNFYVRPDIETKLYGATVNLVKNQRRFSVQAPFMLNSRQKKSAGSLLYGGEFYWGSAKGDSAFIPSLLTDKYPHADVSKVDFITFGPGIGYGYTFVMKGHFFATAMATVNADVSYIKEWAENDKLNTSWKFNPNLKVRSALGYNKEKWGVALSYTSNRLFFKATEADGRYLNYNDNYKLQYVRRIDAGKTVPKVTGFVKKVINKIGLGFLVN